MSTLKTFSRKASRPVGVLAGALLILAGCSSLLDVKNPNDVTESALDNPAAAPNIVNGILASTARMFTAVTTPYSVATDELDWTGSRDAWNQLETGILGDYFNEFSDQAFPFVGEARFVADDGIKRVRQLDLDGKLNDRSQLARAFLYGALVYASIADMYDDYAFSSKTEASKPIGRAQMGTLYDKAIAYLDTAYTIATSANTAAFVALRYPALASRARIKHAKAVWVSITPKGAYPRAVTLINDAGANTDATAAIALGSPDQVYAITNSVGAEAGINIWFEVNGRKENSVSVSFKNLLDPVTGAADIRVAAVTAAFAAAGTQAGPMTMVSNRELRLILAEAALAAGNNATVQTQINAVRALDAGRTAWDGVTPAPLAMLQHERRVQLWLQRRRLMDMYRFNLKDAKWVASGNYESAFSVNGALFPIPQVERLGNPCVNDPAGC